MSEFEFFLETAENTDLPERQERCQKAIRALLKAIAMRLFICVLLGWVVLRTDLALWAVGLMFLVMLINISGILPLAAELKKRRQEWKLLLEEEDT